MRLATWNLNHRIGKTRFRPEAADAINALAVDLIVLTEFYPQANEARFCSVLKSGGYMYQESTHDHAERANRVLIASRFPITPLHLKAPTFDSQFPSNQLAVKVPDWDLNILGVRVPAYTRPDKEMLAAAWNWLERTAAELIKSPSIIIGDLNVSATAPKSAACQSFNRILGTWHRATPSGRATYYGRGGRTSELDYALSTPHRAFTAAEHLVRVGETELAGTSRAISDHAVLSCQVGLV